MQDVSDKLLAQLDEGLDQDLQVFNGFGASFFVRVQAIGKLLDLIALCFRNIRARRQPQIVHHQ